MRIGNLVLILAAACPRSRNYKPAPRCPIMWCAIGRNCPQVGTSVKSRHGLRVDADGNVWAVDVEAHRIMKWTTSGRLLMMIGGVDGAAGNDDSKDGPISVRRSACTTCAA